MPEGQQRYASTFISSVSDFIIRTLPYASHPPKVIPVGLSVLFMGKEDWLNHVLYLVVDQELPPFRVVEGTGFRAMYPLAPASGAPVAAVAAREYLTVSADTVKNRLMKIYKEGSEQLQHFFAQQPPFRRYSGTTDLWTSEAGQGFLSLTLHWVDDSFDEVHKVVLGMEHLPVSHTSVVLAQAVANILNKFNLADRVCHWPSFSTAPTSPLSFNLFLPVSFFHTQFLFLISDNGSNLQEQFVDQLHCLLPKWNPLMKLNCFAHVANLAVQSVLDLCQSILDPVCPLLGFFPATSSPV